MDFLLTEKGDGGEFIINQSGDIETDDTFQNAVYLSLFNGDCFYNVYTKNKTDNSFIEAISKTITLENLQNAQTKAQNLLKWMIDESIARNIDVFAYGKKGKISADITIQQDDNTIKKYSVLWEQEKVYLKNV